MSVFGEIKPIKSMNDVFTDAHWGQLEIFATELLRTTARPFVICFLTNGLVIQFARVAMVDSGLPSEHIEVYPSHVELVYTLDKHNNYCAAKGLKQLVHMLSCDTSQLGMPPQLFHPQFPHEQFVFTRRLGCGSSAAAVEVKVSSLSERYLLSFIFLKNL